MPILTLDEARSLITGAPTSSVRHDDADVMADIETAEEAVADVVGPLEPRSVTVTGVSHSAGMVLPVGPFVGPITALTVDGVTYTDWSNVTVDGFGIAHGLPVGVCTLTYVAGWVTLPARANKAVREQFKHVWSFRRGNTRTADAERGAAHMMPWRVAELIEPYRWDGARP